MNEETPAVRDANKAFRKEEQRKDGAAAWSEYSKLEKTTQDKTARLRAQRLARDEAAPVASAKPATKPATNPAAKAAAKPRKAATSPRAKRARTASASTIADDGA